MKIRRLRLTILPRILIFNLLVLFLPIASLLSLTTYERQLLGALEHALVQQGRLLAAALAGGTGPLGAESLRILTDLAGRHEARLRVIDTDGRLLADTSRLGPRRETPPDGDKSRYAGITVPEPGADESLLYRVGTFPVRFYRGYLRPPQPALETTEFYSGREILRGDEVLTALEGRYGAATRVSSGGQVSVTLYSAIPIRRSGEVVGAVLVSQSTFRILGNLYELRLDLVRIFFISLATALSLSLVAAATITAPLRRLGRAAGTMLDPRGREARAMPCLNRGDEVGELARSLDEAGRRISRHIGFIESFASDVAHEIKNPVASIRSAAELLDGMKAPVERRFFIGRILAESDRIVETVDGMRELSELDTRLEQGTAPAADISDILRRFAIRFEEERGITIAAVLPRAPVRAMVLEARLQQAVAACVDNAVRFSPPDTPIELVLTAEEGSAVIEIRDGGPGIPPENRAKIFDRFFTQRPEDHGRHRGIGLAVARAIVDAHGGSISAGDRQDGETGAVIRIELPLLQAGGKKF